MKWIIREQQLQETRFNAGSKAREDVDAILISMGYEPLTAKMTPDPESMAGKPLKKVVTHVTRGTEWKACMKQAQSGDTVVIQYPVRNHTVLFSRSLCMLKKRGVKLVGIIHDLEALRMAIDTNSSKASRIRFRLEEVSALKYFSAIVVHNKQMKQTIHEMFGVPMEKMISLKIFDYLYEPADHAQKAFADGAVMIAGNLSRQKSGYIYELPQDVPFEMYGANLDETAVLSDNITYLGKVLPDELPEKLCGGFGLVWDGPSAKTCTGVFGEYLRFNNPHKASLYLASGLPLIVWSESALAEFVRANGCGICIDSLETLAEVLKGIDAEKYAEIVRNVERVGKLVRTGYFMKEAVRKASGD